MTGMLVAAWIPDKPDAIYGAATGALIAFIGGLLANRHARRRQQLDLTHNAAERERERQHGAQQRELERLHSLRKEIYLPFVDAAAHAIAFVPQIPTCPIDQLKTLDPLVVLGRQFARVSLIAPPEIIEAVATGFLTLQGVAMILINRRWAIEKVSGELALSQRTVEWMISRQKNLGERMDAMVDTGEAKPQFQVLFEQHQSLSAQIQEEIARQSPLAETKLKTELHLQRDCAQLILPIQEHTTNMFLAMRREIGLPIDETWYRNFNASAMDKAVAMTLKFQDELQSAILCEQLPGTCVLTELTGQ